MLSAEFIVAFFMFLQPPVFGFLFFALVRNGIISTHLFSFLKTSRRRLQSVKFFECAAHPRLLNAVQYDIFILSFCVLFILYDVDLIFFFTEAVNYEGWSYFEFTFVMANFLLLVLGLWYDYIKLGFNWSH